MERGSALDSDDAIFHELCDFVLAVPEIGEEFRRILTDLGWVATQGEVVVAHLEPNPRQLGGDPGGQDRLEQPPRPTPGPPSSF